MIKRFRMVNLLLVLLCSVCLWTNSADAKEITIRAVTFQTPGPATKGFEWFLEQVNQRGKGIVQIKLVGGPESIPGRDQPEAVRRGSIDLSLVPTSYYMNLVPAGHSLTFSPLTPAEERQSGYYDFLTKVHTEGGLHFVGRENWGTLFNIWTNKAVKRPQDFKGQMLRVGKSPTKLVQYLGAEAVSIPISDIYSAVDRGIVDGFVLPAEFVVEHSLYEVVDYGVRPGFWNRDEVVIMNAKKWDQLPTEAKKILNNVQQELEADMIKASEKLMDRSFETCVNNGLEVIQFTREDGEWLSTKANEVGLKELKEKMDPDNFAKVMNFFSMSK